MHASHGEAPRPPQACSSHRFIPHLVARPSTPSCLRQGVATAGLPGGHGQRVGHGSVHERHRGAARPDARGSCPPRGPHPASQLSLAQVGETRQDERVRTATRSTSDFKWSRSIGGPAYSSPMAASVRRTAPEHPRGGLGESGVALAHASKRPLEMFSALLPDEPPSPWTSLAPTSKPVMKWVARAHSAPVSSVRLAARRVER